MIESALRLLSLLNADQGSSLTESDVSFGTPLVYTGGDARGPNEVSVVINSPNHRGSASVRYFRIDLSVLFNGVTVKFPFGDVTDSDGLIPLLNQYYGTDFTVDMFTTTTVTDPGNGDNKTLVLTAKGGDYYVSGTVTLTDAALPETVPFISELITQQEFNGFKYFGFEDQLSTGQSYVRLETYPVDFTPMVDELSYFGAEDINEDFANALKQATGLDWVYQDGLASRNLFGASLLYYGRTEDAPTVYHANTDYAYVVVLALNSDYCSDQFGAMYLHFNAELGFLTTVKVGTKSSTYFNSIVPDVPYTSVGVITRWQVYFNYTFGGFDLKLIISISDYVSGTAIRDLDMYPPTILMGDVTYTKAIVQDGWCGYIVESGDPTTNEVAGATYDVILNDGRYREIGPGNPSQTFDVNMVNTQYSYYLVSNATADIPFGHLSGDDGPLDSNYVVEYAGSGGNIIYNFGIWNGYGPIPDIRVSARFRAQGSTTYLSYINAPTYLKIGDAEYRKVTGGTGNRVYYYLRDSSFQTAHLANFTTGPKTVIVLDERFMEVV